MQLACIVNMVPRWKRLHMRVFIVVRSDSPSPDLLNRQRDTITNMLELLRIRAEPVVLHWTPNYVSSSDGSNSEASGTYPSEGDSIIIDIFRNSGAPDGRKDVLWGEEVSSRPLPPPNLIQEADADVKWS